MAQNSVHNVVALNNYGLTKVKQWLDPISYKFIQKLCPLLWAVFSIVFNNSSLEFFSDIILPFFVKNKKTDYSIL